MLNFRLFFPPQPNTKIKRNSSIELLRMLAILMIISMHLMGKWWTTSSVVNREIIIFFNSFFNTGNSLFILISGYYRVNFKLEKMVHLWFQTLTYTIPLFFLSWLFLESPVDGKFVLHSFFPILTNYKWFITSYLILYTLSPFLNRFLEQLSKEQMLRLILLGCFFFIFSPTVLLISIQNDAGKGIVNMVLVYIIGRYIRLFGVPDFIIANKKHIAYLCVLLAFIGNSVFSFMKGQISGYYAYDCSLFMLCLSIVIFTIFKELKFDSSLINSLAKYCFPIYLFSDIVWLLLNNYIISIKDSLYCWFMMPLLLLAAILASIIYEMLRKLLFSRLEEKAYYIVEQCINNILRKYNGKLN